MTELTIFEASLERIWHHRLWRPLNLSGGGALTGFAYPGMQKCSPQLVYYGEKYSQLKLMNIQNNSENFLVNFWYLNISLLVGPTFIP
jgi:hypothetical protein